MRDGGFVRAGEQCLGRTGGTGASVEHLDAVERADGIDCLARDLLRIYVRVRVDNCHGFLLQRLPSYPNQEVWGR